MKAVVSTRQDLTKAIDELGLKKGVEIGVFHGEFSEYLLSNSKLEKLWSVDAWDPHIKGSVFKKWGINNGKLEKAFEDAVRRLDAFGGRSTIIRKPSLEAISMFADNELDFIYIDASHRFSGVALDLINWWPKLKMGGIFAGHDYWECYRFEVMEAVNGFLVEHQQVLHLTTDELNNRNQPKYPPTWWTIKEEKTKVQYEAEVIAAKPVLLADKAKLLKKGVRVVLPHQYWSAEKEEECEPQ